MAGGTRMNGLALLLQDKGFLLEEWDKDMLTFKKCPLCSISNYMPKLNELGYACPVCTQDPLPLQDFLKRINVSYQIDPTDISELVEKYMDPLLDPDLVKGYSTGYSSLDEAVGGFKPQHLIILAADTGMGKSVFGINLLINATNEGVKTSYFDLENGKMASMSRIICIKGCVPTNIFEDADNVTKIVEIEESLKGKLNYRDHEALDAFIGDKKGLQMAKMIGGLIEGDAQDGVKLFLIDPLENFEEDDKAYVAIGNVVNYFKDLAQKLNITIIILHHLKKPTSISANNVSDLQELQVPRYRIPTIHDLTGSSKIANKAPHVWTMVRQKEDSDEKKRGRILFRILKGRFNQNKDLYFNMNLQNLRIAEVKM